MKIKYIFAFIIFILIPVNISLAGNPFVVSEFINENNILGRTTDFKGKVINTFWVSLLEQQEGIDIACGDVDSDGKDEIVTSFKSGPSRIKIFSQEGKEKYQDFLVFDKKYLGGANITLGDINMDGNEEIIAVSKKGSSLIKVYNHEGKFLNVAFYPFTPNYRGSINLAVGDVNGDEKVEIIAATGQGTRSEVRIFDNEGKLLPINYLPFSSNFLGGVSVASGDIEGDGIDEVAACQENNGSWCKIYKYDNQRIILNEWPVFKNNSGVKINFEDIDRDGEEELVVSTKESANQKIKVFKSTKEKIKEFDTFNGGTNNIEFDIFFDSYKDIAKVTYVDDGDTIYLNNGREVRYIGVDTPEIGEDFYVESTNRNKELLDGKEVALEYDKQKIDPYGRLLAYVYSNGDFINSKLLEEGLARIKTFPPNEKYLDLLKEKEEEAKEKEIGIWENKDNGKSSLWDLFNIFKIFF